MRTTPVSVPFFSRTRSEGWPHHGRTFSIYPCPLSFWLTLPRESCPRLDVVHPCVVFLACINLELFLALSPGNSPSFLMVWPQYASFLASTVSNSSFFTPALLRTHSFVSLLSTKPAEFFLSLSSQRHQDVFLQLSQPYVATGHTSAFISRIFVEIRMLWLFHIFCSDAPVAWTLFNIVENSVVHSPSSVIGTQGTVTHQLLQLFILNEYAAHYAVAHHYLGLVDVDE